MLLPIALGMTGVWMVHYPMFLSRFGLIQTDPGDTRLNNYLLEHSYRWACSDPGHHALWDPPFYYPARNVAAFSDLLLGAAPLYWGWRAVGQPPDTAFQLWMISVSGLNYLAAYILFRGGLRFGRLGAAAGTFLFAFGAPRINQLGHQQLLPCFYISSALYALARIFSDGGLGPARRAALWLVSSLSIIAQLYTAFYPGWFLILALTLALPLALALPSCRPTLVRALGRDAPAILAAAALGWLALHPFLVHYLRAARELGPRSLTEVLQMVPTRWSWLWAGPDHWFWGWLARFEPFPRIPSEGENRLGCGIVTPLVCAAGLFFQRDRALCQLAAFVLLGLWLCVTRLPGDLLAGAAVAVAAYCGAALFHERDRTWPRALALIGVVAFLGLVRFPNPFVLTLGLIAIALVLAEIARRRAEPLRLVLPTLTLFALCGNLFVPQVLLIALGLVAPLVVVSEYFRTPWRQAARPLAASVLVILLALLVYPDRPAVLIAGLVAPPVMLAATSPRRLRPPARIQAWLVLAALPATVYFFHIDTLWQHIYLDVPGGSAIRAVGRVILLMLVPLAIGLASFLMTLEVRRQTALACVIGLLCLIEQGLSTSAYDKAAKRLHVAALAARVDPCCAAFYYHTRRAEHLIEFVEPQLDAMWASLTRGVPTINGYSGGWPPDWHPIHKASFGDDLKIQDALLSWLRSRRINADRIQWIDVDTGLSRREPRR